MNQQNKISLIAKTGLFAAFICLITFLHIPVGVNSGYIHVGDAIIYLAACILPLPYAMAAGAIGAGLCDTLSGAVIWVIPTIIIKPLITLCFQRGGKLLCTRNVIAVFAGGFITIGGYYIAECIITSNWVAPLFSMPMSAVQAAGSGVVYLIIACLADRCGLLKKLENRR